MKGVRDLSSNDERDNNTLMGYLSIALYLTTSIISILTNRFLMTSVDKIGSYLLNFIQFTCESCVIYFLTFINKCIFHQFHFELKKLLSLIPTAIIFTSTSLLNNKTLQYCPLATYQVVKSLTPLFNIAVSFFFLNKTTPFYSCLCCVGIIIGFVLGLIGEQNSTENHFIDQKSNTLHQGIICGILSSIAMAIFSISSKDAIEKFNGNQWNVLQYMIPMTAFFFFIISYFTGELNDLIYSHHHITFYIFNAIGGLMMSCLNISAFLCLKYTSSLTHNITATVVTTLTTIISFFIFGEEQITIFKFFGIVIIVVCSILYVVLQKPNQEIKGTSLDIDVVDVKTLGNIPKFEETNESL